jgi:hypothetical protein
MFERAHSFGIGRVNSNEIQKAMEEFLKKKFNFSTKTSQLGKTLLRINYFDEKIDEGLQKDNKITILIEPEKNVYIKVNGKLPESQILPLWEELKEKFGSQDEQKDMEEEIHTKEEIINKIVTKIQKEGYKIKLSDVELFMDNFQEKYMRLPQKDEINSIVKGYIIMINEEDITDIESETKELYKDLPINIEYNNFKDPQEILVQTKSRTPISLYSYENGILTIEKPIGRRKCPSCGNEGLIHELDDKTIILLDYPKIYGKKCCCAECGQEWREI